MSKEHLSIVIKTLLILIICVYVSSSWAQDVNYAREVVTELASEKYHGRGYVKKGDKRAASYIAGEFNKFGLNKKGNSYYQKYSFPINTFPGKLGLSIDNIDLVPGEDYVVSLSSPSVNTEFDVVDLRDAGYSLDSLFINFKEKKDGAIYLINDNDTRKYYGKTIPGVDAVAILAEKKPYWHVSNGKTIEKTIWIKINEEKVPKNAATLKLKVKNKFIDKYQTQNVVGWIQGTKYPEKYYVFTAHYDHLGMMGNETYFPGANDNASGVAMILDLARHFSKPENRPEYSVAFIAFSGEEAGLIGSDYFAENPLIPLGNIRLVVNLDMVGSGSDGITIVNGSLYDGLVKEINTINDKHNLLNSIALRGESCNSDHCPFYQKGVKSIFIYTRGKELKEYHTIYDTSEDFPFTAYDGLFELITRIVY